MFKQLGLSQESAQKLVDFQAQREVALRDSAAKAIEDMRVQWRAEASKDPVIGLNLDTTVKEKIGQALNLLDPEVVSKFKEDMELTGYGDHPVLIRVMYELALKVTSGKHVSGTPSEASQIKPGTPSQVSAASKLYPNLPR